MKNETRLFVVATVLFSITIVGCSKKASNVGKGVYSYHEAIGATPSEWNPHLLKGTNANFINITATMGFITPGMDEDKNFVWKYEMAESIEDITSTFDNKAKFNISEDARNRVYEIRLNRNAKWANGVAINADTYIYSMKQLLNYEMMNNRASVFTDNIAAIYGAKEYMYNGKSIYTFFTGPDNFNVVGDYVYTQNNEQVFYSVDAVNPKLWGMSLRELHSESQHPEWFIKDGTDFFSMLESQPKNEDGYTALTVSLYPYIQQIAINIAGEGAANQWPIICVYQTFYTGTWDDVGFYKTDDYTLIFVTKNELSRENLFSQLTTNFLVYEDLYEAGKTRVGNLLTTNYGTSVDTYMSYGPYKLISLERDRQIVLEKNNNWYGYTDGQHEGMYQTTRVYGEVINSHSTAMNAFLKGELEMVTLTASDMTKYYTSDHLLKADEPLVFSIAMNNNLDTLRGLENQAGGNVNKRVGAYKTFREAFSYAINRLTFVNKGTAGSKPQYGLFNNQYYYDASNDPNSVYRTSEIGMKVIVDHYGLQYGEGMEYETLQEAYDSVNGFDLDKAKALFQQTYLQMKADGNYVDGQLIKLNCVASEQRELTEEKITQQRLLNGFIDEATKGTGFENKIEITFVRSDNMDADFHDGIYEMILAVKMGAEKSPYHQISKYIVDKNEGAGNYLVPEAAAFDPRNEEMTLTINGESITKSIRWWANQINGYGGNYDNAPIEIKLYILASLEQYLLDNFVDIPLYSRCQVYLNSKKINQGSTTYNSYYQFGGIGYITYNYDDRDWAAYVKNHGGHLEYDD